MNIKRILAAFVGLIVVLGVGVIVAKRVADSRFYDRYTPGQPTQYTVRTIDEEKEYRRESFTFEGAPGVLVPTVAAYPKEGEGPFPCVIMLYGIGQRMTFLDDIASYYTESGFALIMPEQHMRGEREPNDLSDIDAALGLRDRAAFTVNEARRLIDTLEQRPNIDANQIYLWGLSYGAICSAPTLAKEPRFKAGVFTVGGGALNDVLDRPDALSDLGPWRPVVLTAVKSLLRPLEPTWYIADASPRPILFQNALQDQIIPRESAEALHAAAHEPKTIIWYDCTHEGNDGEMVPQMIREGVAWLKGVGEGATHQALITSTQIR